jgi:hypothetical protein
MGRSFISDGCSLQEWLYGTTRLKTGFNPTENPETVKLWIKEHPEEWSVYRHTIEGFGKIVKGYAREHYDVIIHLPVEFPFVSDGHRPASEIFRSASEQLLRETYDELGICPIEVRGSLHERLITIVSRLNLGTVRNTEEAIAMAECYKKERVDSIRII